MPKKPRQDVSAVESPAPAVERAVQLLRLMGERPGGLSTHELADVTKTPRATLYRILSVLTSHGFVQEAEDGPARYQLGPAVAKLGRQAPQPRNFVALAQPLMEHLAQTVRETVKLVVIDGLDALTVAVVDTGLDARVTSRVGTRMPLYIGASQRLLLAHAGADLQHRVLAMPLAPRTSRTITDPQRLHGKPAAARARKARPRPTARVSTVSVPLRRWCAAPATPSLAHSPSSTFSTARPPRNSRRSWRPSKRPRTRFQLGSSNERRSGSRCPDGRWRMTPNWQDFAARSSRTST